MIKKLGLAWRVSTWWMRICFLVLVFLAIRALADIANPHQPVSSPLIAAYVPAKKPADVDFAAEPAIVQRWLAGESKDEMRGTKSRYWTNTSLNTVNFKFPYQGEQSGTIMFIGTNERSLLFYVQKGQLICHSGYKYGTCFVLVKFDESKAQYIEASKVSDESTTISIRDPAFLKRLNKSKRLAIQAEIYHNGMPIFQFDVTGLAEATSRSATAL